MNIITIREAAQRLNYSDTNIRNAIKSEALAATRLGRSWAIKGSDFALYVRTLPVERQALVLVRELTERIEGNMDAARQQCGAGLCEDAGAMACLCCMNNAHALDGEIMAMRILVSEVQDETA